MRATDEACVYLEHPLFAEDGKRALPDHKTMEKHAETWRPWRSVASWYMWRATEQ